MKIYQFLSWAALSGVAYAADPSAVTERSTTIKKSERVTTEVPLSITITGNQEAPKVLYILPWKTVEEGAPDPYVSGIIEDVFSPLDPVEFERSVQWHEIGHAPVSSSVKETK